MFGNMYHINHIKIYVIKVSYKSININLNFLFLYCKCVTNTTEDGGPRYCATVKLTQIHMYNLVEVLKSIRQNPVMMIWEMNDWINDWIIGSHQLHVYSDN